MDNVLKRIRLDAGLSQNRFAQRAGITRNTVIRCEQGLYTLPPGGVLRVASELSDLSESRLEELYKQFQREQRQQSGQVYKPLARPTLLADWRAEYGVSRVGFCIDFCVHPAVISTYEAGRMKSIPQQLVQALTEAGHFQSISNLVGGSRAAA